MDSCFHRNDRLLYVLIKEALTLQLDTKTVSLSKNRFLDSALLRSPLGTPDGGNDTNKRIDYTQLVSFAAGPIGIAWGVKGGLYGIARGVENQTFTLLDEIIAIYSASVSCH